MSEPLRVRRNRYKARLLDSLSSEIGQWDTERDDELEYGLTFAQCDAVRDEIGRELYRRALRLTPRTSPVGEVAGG